MRQRRRARWLAGRYANVDGIPFQVPVAARDSPSITALFAIDADRAREMMPGQELHPLRLLQRGVLLVAVVDYRHTSIGRYVEFCIGVMCTRGRAPAPRVLPLALPRLFGTGALIYDLPVSTEISVKGGRGIWGMEKRRASLDFVIGERTVSSQYDLDGELVARIDIPKPSRAPVPFAMSGVGYGAFRGMLTKSRIAVGGRTGIPLRQGSARLLLGDHPRADPLKRLDIDPRPLFVCYTPAVAGVLDDHVETWFLTADEPPEAPVGGLESVVDLGLDESWPPPPDRARSDRLMGRLDPAQGLAPRARHEVGAP
jgi:hypothetical protein